VAPLSPSSRAARPLDHFARNVVSFPIGVLRPDADRAPVARRRSVRTPNGVHRLFVLSDDGTASVSSFREIPRFEASLHTRDAPSTPRSSAALARRPMAHQAGHAMDAGAESRATLARCLCRLQNADSAGARFWGQVQRFPGRLGVLQVKGAASGETSPIAGKALYEALFPDHIAAGRSLHGRRGSTVRVVRGLTQKPCKWAFSVVCYGELLTLRGYETGTFWDWRALAGTRDISRRSEGRARDSRSRPLVRSSCKEDVGVARAGAMLTPSFGTEGVA